MFCKWQRVHIVIIIVARTRVDAVSQQIFSLTRKDIGFSQKPAYSTSLSKHSCLANVQQF